MTLKFKHYATGKIIEIFFDAMYGDEQIFKDKNEKIYLITEDKHQRIYLKGTSYFLI